MKAYKLTLSIMCDEEVFEAEDLKEAELIADEMFLNNVHVTLEEIKEEK